MTLLNPGGIERDGLRVGVGKRDGAGRDGFPAALGFGDEAAALPGRGVLALRPAWASWIPGTVPWPKRNWVMRERKAMWSSFQMPRSCGLMRPSAETAQASVKIREAPPTARLPRWTRCQSLAIAISAGILAHGRDDDAVAEEDIANLQYIE